MKAIEYLEGKYRSKNGLSVSDAEAEILGIPVPLRGGWMQKLPQEDLTLDQARGLVGLMKAQLRDSHSPRRKACAQWAIETIRKTFGLEAEAEAVAQWKKRETKKARQKKKRGQSQAQKPRVHFASTDAFLESYEWRRVRMEAIKKYGARCQCCGASPRDGVKINVDHIKPRKLFPELALSLTNLQVLCHICNHGKGNWDMTDWRSDGRKEPERGSA